MFDVGCFPLPLLHSAFILLHSPSEGGRKPLSQGVEVCKDFRILGACPAPAEEAADITGLYTARYGVPKAGTKVYVQVNQVIDGWESLPTIYSAIVPAAS